jgi:hypothetical protein
VILFGDNPDVCLSVDRALCFGWFDGIRKGSKKKWGGNGRPFAFGTHYFGMNAIPCGLTSPVTTFAMTPVSKFTVPTEVSAAV